jgi:hypothetical protein
MVGLPTIANLLWSILNSKWIKDFDVKPKIFEPTIGRHRENSSRYWYKQ